MGYILVALALLTALVLFDLILSFAITRRLRVHATRMADLERMLQPRPGLEPGSAVPDFMATAVTGEAVSRDALLGRTSIVAFISPNCPGCHEQLPALQDRLRQAKSSGGGTIVVVVSHDDDAAADLVTTMGGLATVIVEPDAALRRDASAMQRAFDVTGYPSFFEVDAAATVSTATLIVDDLAPGTTTALR